MFFIILLGAVQHGLLVEDLAQVGAVPDPVQGLLVDDALAGVGEGVGLVEGGVEEAQFHEGVRVHVANGRD